jgi:hypothetical protein
LAIAGGGISSKPLSSGSIAGLEVTNAVISAAVGTATGTGAASAVATAVINSVGSASGVGSAQAVGATIVGAAGTAAGVGSASASGTAIRSSQGAASGTGVAAATATAIAASSSSHATRTNFVLDNLTPRISDTAAGGGSSLPQSVNGVTVSNAGQGVDQGLPFLDLSFSGTAIADTYFDVFFSINSAQTSLFVPASASDIWSTQIWLRRISGSLPAGGYFYLSIGVDDAAFGYLNELSGGIQIFDTGQLPTTLTKYTNTTNGAGPVNTAYQTGRRPISESALRAGSSNVLRPLLI